MILSQIKIVSNIFLLGLNFYGLEFRNYLQIHEFGVLDFMRKKKNHEVMHFVNTLKTSSVYLV